jgi:hypothetical protein
VDYEDSLDREDAGDEVEAPCCICGVIVPIEYATSLVLTPPGHDEDESHQLYCHGHHLRGLIVDSIPLHPAITGDEALTDTGHDDDEEPDPALVHALERHFERNDALLAQLTALGASLTTTARIMVQFEAPNQAQAAHLAAALYSEGYLVLALVPAEADESGPWHVEASIERTPAAAASDEVTRELVRLAASYEAEYGGWSVRR